ncbi:MAG: hypothetical protein KC441_02495 [Anaerolineales bacterium]|nr:hypothetical protein [Anaerolineales bacterium]
MFLASGIWFEFGEAAACLGIVSLIGLLGAGIYWLRRSFNEHYEVIPRGKEKQP